MSRQMQIGFAAVAAVLVAGLLAVGITYAVTLQAEREKAVHCAINEC